MADWSGLEAALEAFLAHLEARHYAAATIADRRWEIGRFITFAADRGASEPIEITSALLEAYRRKLFLHKKRDGKPLSIFTQHATLKEITAFCAWLAKGGRVIANPAENFELPRLPRKLPKDVLSPAEAERVLANPDVRTALGLRDRAILETLYSTGIRRAECCSLQIFQVDFDRGVVMVRSGKGGHDRVVPIGERALLWVSRYLDDVRPRLAKDPDPGALFLTYAGNQISAVSMGQIVGEHIRASGVREHGACHLFRHTMATAMLEGGAELRYVQEMLGHAQVTTTEIYTRVSVKALKAAHTKAHPARLRGDL